VHPLQNVVGARRASWRIINQIKMQHESESGDSSANKAELCGEYQKKIETELEDVRVSAPPCTGTPHSSAVRWL
jgi:hypothetical protein